MNVYISLVHNRLKQKTTGERINKLLYVYTIEYHSVIKSNEIPIHATRWINLKSSMLNERSQTQRSTVAFHLYETENKQN